MRVLLVISNMLTIHGGAEITSHVLLHRLAREAGWEGRIATHHPISQNRMLPGGIRIDAYRDLQELKELIHSWRPQLIVGSLRGAVDAMRLAEHFCIPGILYIHSYEFAPPNARQAEEWRYITAGTTLDDITVGFVLSAADHIFACSSHMRRVMQKRHGVEADVLYPGWMEKDLVVPGHQKGNSDCITGICGYRHKGIELFIELARRFPNEQFLLAGEPGSNISLSFLKELRGIPNIALPGILTVQELMRQSKVMLVPSQWPEPFGRIAVEAMATGVPLLASRNGGLAEIVGDTPLGVTSFASVDAWERRLQDLLASKRKQKELAELGKARAGKFINCDRVSPLVEVAGKLAGRNKQTQPVLEVLFDGSRSSIESFALVNARLEREMAAAGWKVSDYDPACFETPDCVIHHNYLTDFTKFLPPATGHCIAVRTSDFGPYPREWADKIIKDFDQLWVHTHWIRHQAEASGIPGERIRLVPNGIDPDVFTPQGPLHALPGEKKFTFLFVGGAVARKGIDLLLKAYVQAFSAEDAVRLVIKGHSDNAFYNGRESDTDIQALQNDPTAPEVVHIDDHLSERELAALYRSAEVGVFPYRAEGFMMPILEAMACGTPSVVPRFGACLDYCSDATSFFVPAVRVQLPLNKRFKMKAGIEVHYEAVDFCEVRIQALADGMRRAFEAPKEEIEAKAAAGVKTAHGSFTWKQSAAKAMQCIEELVGGPAPVRFNALRRKNEKAQRQMEAVREMSIQAMGFSTSTSSNAPVPSGKTDLDE